MILSLRQFKVVTACYRNKFMVWIIILSHEANGLATPKNFNFFHHYLKA